MIFKKDKKILNASAIKTLLLKILSTILLLHPVPSYTLNLDGIDGAISLAYERAGAWPKIASMLCNKDKDRALYDRQGCEAFGMGMAATGASLLMINRFYTDFYHQVYAQVGLKDRQRMRQISLKNLYGGDKECEAEADRAIRNLPEGAGTSAIYVEQGSCMVGFYTDALRSISKLLLKNPQYVSIFNHFFYPDPQKYQKLIMASFGDIMEFIGNNDPENIMPPLIYQVAKDDLMDWYGRWSAPQVRQAHKSVRQWLYTYLKGKHPIKDYLTETQTMRVNQETYHLILDAWNETSRAYSACMGILHQQNLTHGFCLDSTNDIRYIAYTHKGPFFTIRSIDLRDFQLYKKPPFAYRYYYTFKLIDGKFYLHQYSREVFYCQECGDDALADSPQDEAKEGEALLLRTQIFYRQSRDDPQKQHLISMQDFFHNPQRVDLNSTPLLSHLHQQCFAKNLCQHVQPEDVNKVKAWLDGLLSYSQSWRALNFPKNPQELP